MSKDQGNELSGTLSFAGEEADGFSVVQFGNDGQSIFDKLVEEAAWAAMAGPVTVTYLPGFGPDAE